jgi:hypothetical protein
MLRVATFEDDVDLDPEVLALPAKQPDEDKLEQVEEEVPAQFEDKPAQEVQVEEPVQPEGPQEIPGMPQETPGVPEEAAPELRRSKRVRFQTREPYVPSMTGSKYAVAVTQLEDHGALHPDAHMMFCQSMMDNQPDVVAAIMTQLSLKAGLKEWGDGAQEAVHSEMKQLHFRDTFKPMHWHELNETQKKTVLESHMFLKQKRDSKIKDRTVADGNKQRDFISKEEASSPTDNGRAI